MIAGSATLSVRFAVAPAAEISSHERVEDVAAAHSPEAETVRGIYRASIEWHALEDGLWWLQVLNERGEIVDGGIGDSAEDALLEVYERLIPPT
jgi:hypothetical protein